MLPEFCAYQRAGLPPCSRRFTRDWTHCRRVRIPLASLAQHAGVDVSGSEGRLFTALQVWKSRHPDCS